MPTIKLEIEQTEQNMVAASAFFAMLANGKSLPAPAPKAVVAKQEPEQAAQDEPDVEAPATKHEPTEGLPATVDISVGLDADGVPWDERIHSGSKTKLKKEETWKLTRGVDKDLVAAVRAELDSYDWPSIVMGKGPEPEVDDNTAQNAFGSKTAGATGGKWADKPPVDMATFNRHIMAAVKAGTVTQQQFMATLNQHGFQNVSQLLTQPGATNNILDAVGIAYEQ